MPSPGGWRGVQVDTAGIKDLLRDLGRIDKGIRSAAVKELRGIGDTVRDRVRSSTEPPFRTGKTRRSVRTSVRGGTISLYSNEPQSPVWHWGGTIRPRGAPIRFPETRFVSEEVEEEAKRVEQRLGGFVDGIADRYGF